MPKDLRQFRTSIIEPLMIEIDAKRFAKNARSETRFRSLRHSHGFGIARSEKFIAEEIASALYRRSSESCSRAYRTPDVLCG